MTLNFLGRTEEAEAALEALIAMAPHDARAHHLLAGLRKQSAQRNHIDRLHDSYVAARAPRDRLLLGYSLAKELEDVGRADDALAAGEGLGRGVAHRDGEAGARHAPPRAHLVCNERVSHADRRHDGPLQEVAGVEDARALGGGRGLRQVAALSALQRPRWRFALRGGGWGGHGTLQAQAQERKRNVGL